jgi:hypothetical protein
LLAFDVCHLAPIMLEVDSSSVPITHLLYKRIKNCEVNLCVHGEVTENRPEYSGAGTGTTETIFAERNSLSWVVRGLPDDQKIIVICEHPLR